MGAVLRQVNKRNRGPWEEFINRLDIESELIIRNLKLI